MTERQTTARWKGPRRKAGRLIDLIRSPTDLWLALRMTGWALVLPALKRAVALPKLARLMWREGAGAPDDRDVERVVRLAVLAARFRPLPRGDNCLERSLIIYRYLSALSIEPHLVVAVRSEEHELRGHAWVTLDGEQVIEEDVSGFTPMVELGRRGARLGQV